MCIAVGLGRLFSIFVAIPWLVLRLTVRKTQASKKGAREGAVKC